MRDISIFLYNKDPYIISQSIFIDHLTCAKHWGYRTEEVLVFIEHIPYSMYCAGAFACVFVSSEGWGVGTKKKYGREERRILARVSVLFITGIHTYLVELVFYLHKGLRNLSECKF